MKPGRSLQLQFQPRPVINTYCYYFNHSYLSRGGGRGFNLISGGFSCVGVVTATVGITWACSGLGLGGSWGAGTLKPEVQLRISKLYDSKIECSAIRNRICATETFVFHATLFISYLTFESSMFHPHVQARCLPDQAHPYPCSNAADAEGAADAFCVMMASSLTDLLLMLGQVLGTSWDLNSWHQSLCRYYQNRPARPVEELTIGALHEIGQKSAIHKMNQSNGNTVIWDSFQIPSLWSLVLSESQEANGDGDEATIRPFESTPFTGLSRESLLAWRKIFW